MTLFSGLCVILHNAPQACSIMAGMLRFCFMTTTKACQGIAVSGLEKEMVWDWVWDRVEVTVGNGLQLTLTPP